MSSAEDAPVSALRRFKKSVSRIASKRKDIRHPPRPESQSERFTRPDDPKTQESPPAFQPWQVDPLLETFSDKLQDVLDVHNTISKAQTSLKGAERMTAALREQSAVALDIAKQDFCFPAKKEANVCGSGAYQETISRENARTLDALEEKIVCGTLESLDETIRSLQKVQSDVSVGLTSTSNTAIHGNQTLCISMLKKLDDLKGVLVDRLLEKRERAVQDADVCQVARLLGHLTTPRVELHCLLEHYSKMMRQKVSSGIVSLSVSSTVQFAQEDGGPGTPTRLSSDIGFTMICMLLDARERCQELLNRHKVLYLMSIFDRWAQQQLRETCEVLLRLIILPMAVPKGLSVVSECMCLFHGYCRAIEFETHLRLQNVVISVLKSPFMDILRKRMEQQRAKIGDLAVDDSLDDSSKMNIVLQEGMEILACLQLNEYILGHEKLSLVQRFREEYVACYSASLPEHSSLGDNLRESLTRAMIGDA